MTNQKVNETAMALAAIAEIDPNFDPEKSCDPQVPWRAVDIHRLKSGLAMFIWPRTPNSRLLVALERSEHCTSRGR